MCRLFAQVTDAHRTACEPLCSEHNALRMQSHLHPHGWGIAWYGARGPRIRRGVMPAHSDAAFVRAGRTARSRIVLAHVRDASVGRVALENTHPFVEGRWVFAHNGTVARFKRSRAVRAALLGALPPERRARLQGQTDSELCFQLLLSRLDVSVRGRGRRRANVEEVREAMTWTVERIRAVADRGDQHSTLNFLLSDGHILCACRNGKPLRFTRSAGDGHRVAIASESIGDGEWQEIPEGGFVGVDGALRVVARPLAG